MRAVDLGEHGEILSRLMPPEAQMLHDFCMARMEYGRVKYEREDGPDYDALPGETREEIADAINRIAMMVVRREARGVPTADIEASAEYLLRAYYLLWIL